MFVYKIRNRKTGKFVANDSWSDEVRETDEGTLFSTKHSLSGHIAYRKIRYFKHLSGKVYLAKGDYEVVKFELKEVASFPLKKPSVKGI